MEKKELDAIIEKYADKSNVTDRIIRELDKSCKDLEKNMKYWMELCVYYRENYFDLLENVTEMLDGRDKDMKKLQDILDAQNERNKKRYQNKEGQNDRL